MTTVRALMSPLASPLAVLAAVPAIGASKLTPVCPLPPATLLAVSLTASLRLGRVSLPHRLQSAGSPPSRGGTRMLTAG